MTDSGSGLGILGPLRLVDDGREVTPAGHRQQTVLAVLACRAGAAVPVRDLADMVWPERPPERPHKALQVIVHRLRRRLDGLGDLTHCPGGYLLTPADGRLDARVFEDGAARAEELVTARRLAEAGRRLDAALALWRGPVLEDFLHLPVVAAAAARLERLRLAATARTIDVGLALGRAESLITPAERLVRADPLSERPRLLLMTVLYAAGHRSAALTAYRTARAELAEELGVDPTHAFQEAHQRILDGEPVAALLRVPAAATPARPVALADAGDAHVAPVPRQLPRPAGGLTGRAPEVAAIDALLTAEDHVAPVCVISGPAGIGKSALAVHAAHRVAGRYPDGQLYVNLRGPGTATAMEPARVLGRFLRALGVPDDRIPAEREEREALYRSELAGRRVLVVLDNAATGSQVAPLLPAAGTSAALITARGALNGIAATRIEPSDSAGQAAC